MSFKGLLIGCTYVIWRPYYGKTIHNYFDAYGLGKATYELRIHQKRDDDTASLYTPSSTKSWCKTKKLSSIQWNVTNTYWFWSPSHIWMTWWEDSMSRENWEGNGRSDEGLRLHTLWRQRKPAPWCMWRSFWSHRLAGTAEMMSVRLRARRCGWKGGWPASWGLETTWYGWVTAAGERWGCRGRQWAEVKSGCQKQWDQERLFFGES